MTVETGDIVFYCYSVSSSLNFFQAFWCISVKYTGTSS